MTDNNKFKKKLSNDYVKKYNKMFETICGNNKLPSILPAVDRIIVIGDIHGDFKELINCLKIGNLVDNDMKWIGGNTVVVQVGDQIDSCRPNINNNCHKEYIDGDLAEDIQILEFMTDLHKEATKYGGAVYSLVGNHEIMNCNNDFRYVSYKNILDFSDKNFENSEDKFKNGLENRKKVFSPGNKYANFMGCTRKIALIIGSNLFVHAGIVDKIAQNYDIDDLNMILSLFLFNELNNPEYINDVFENYEISPLWTRIFGFQPKDISRNECMKLLKPLEKAYNVGRIFVGHTPQIEVGLNSICDGKIHFADNGVSRAFKPFDNNSKNNIKSDGRVAQVIEIIDDGIPRVLKHNE